MLRQGIISLLGGLIQPAGYIGHNIGSAFKLYGYTGLALAILLAMSLSVLQNLSLWVMAGIILSAVSTFLVLALATKIILGEERLIYYHHEIAVMVVTSAVLWLLRQPILPYLDMTLLGVGMFLVWGRIGCLMVGCCHGRPHHWGMRYGAEHVAAGFTPYYVGIPLFPIQAMESLWVLGIILVGSTLVLNGGAPGTALAWYAVGYGLGRFCFEFMRGDPERLYYRGFSEAQWTSLLLMCALIGAELAGILRLHLWHIGSTAFLVAIMIVVALRRRFQGTLKRHFMHPHHICEVAGAIQLASNLAVEKCDICKQNVAPCNVHIGCTSLGIQISASKFKKVVGYTYHYALSYQNGTLPENMARFLAAFILQINHRSDPNEFMEGGHGVFHLFVHTPAAESQDVPQPPNAGGVMKHGVFTEAPTSRYAWSLR
jgi:hypothetical protein